MSQAVEEWRAELLNTGYFNGRQEGSSEQRMIDFQNMVKELEQNQGFTHEDAVAIVSKALNYKPN